MRGGRSGTEFLGRILEAERPHVAQHLQRRSALSTESSAYDGRVIVFAAFFAGGFFRMTEIYCLHGSARTRV